MSAITISASGASTSTFRDVFTAPAHATWPARLVAAYVLLMPLIAGIPRGQIIPMLRLTEVAQVGLMGLAVLAVVSSYGRGSRWRFTFRSVDWWMIAFAFFGSVVPVISLIGRGQIPDVGAVAAAFPIFKYLLLWLFVRLSVRTIADVTTVLMGVVGAGGIVALLAIPEGLGIGPTGAITKSLVSGESGMSDGRAFTLLGSAISSGAVVAIAAGVAFGFAVTYRNVIAAGATGFLMLGAVATGQMSSALGVLVILAVVAWQHRVLLKSVALGFPVVVVVGLLMAPIIEGRLADGASRSIVPQSWLIRWVNVSELYWPEISDGGWILGVHPDTVKLPPDSWRTEVFLESGYMWTLWVGGLPLLLCCIGLLVSSWRSLNVTTTDPMHEIARAAARAAVVFMALFSIIDPHMTLRGGADLLYVLVPTAAAFTPLAATCTRRSDSLRLLRLNNGSELSPTARIQIGEIGGSMLGGSGWPSVSPVDGQDRGVDICVRDRGVTIGEARLYFETEGSAIHGLMLHPVRSVDPEAAALVWRGIALSAGSMRLRSLMVPPGSNGIVEMSRRELKALANEADLLEAQRYRGDRLTAAQQLGSAGDRGSQQTPSGVRLEPQTKLSRVRRIVDVVVAGGGMLVLTPVALVLAVLIRRSSPGPILFRQLRVGGGGRPFQLLKFRSMDNSAGENVHRQSIVDSLSGDDTVVKVENDTRITWIGAIMRAWSLDELPQLLNVLRGEMTLVGPRPSLLWETSMFAPNTRRRLQLTPGIAGLWQASGRGDLSTEEMLELDLEYADSASLANDAKLLGKTAVAVVKKTGAR